MSHTERFAFRLSSDALAKLRRLADAEGERKVSDGEMMRRLIDRAPEPRSQPQNGKRAAGLATSEPRQQPRALMTKADEKAFRAVRRGVESAEKKLAGANNCPDCGLNLSLAGAKHNCQGKQK
jgi:hypothetical protein